MDSFDASDDGEDQDKCEGMEEAGEEEYGRVAVVLDDAAGEETKEHSPKGARGAEQAFDGADNAGREKIGGESLDVR